MKKIYIILTHTGTLLSTIIKKYTKDEFSHISISLDSELKHMYSFGRLRAYNPIIAGFVHENIRKGTFKRFFKTQAKVYEINITDEQYESIKQSIKNIKQDRREYKFNIVGLFAVGLNIRLQFKKSFYCAEFVKYVIENAGIEIDLPEIIKPEDFNNLENKIEGAQEIYKGLLRNYESPKNNLKQKVIMANSRILSFVPSK